MEIWIQKKIVKEAQEVAQCLKHWTPKHKVQSSNPGIDNARVVLCFFFLFLSHEQKPNKDINNSESFTKGIENIDILSRITRCDGCFECIPGSNDKPRKYTHPFSRGKKLV